MDNARQSVRRGRRKRNTGTLPGHARNVSDMTEKAGQVWQCSPFGEAAEESASLKMIKPDELQRARILIVDDCPDSASLLAELLATENYHAVHVTSDAAVVCDLHELNAYDLILLDMHMPYVSGLKVMELLRKSSPGEFLPVIALTGNDDLRLAALDAGAYDFLVKPFDATEILVRVRNMLEVRLLYRRLDEQRRLEQNTTLHDPLTGLPNRRLAVERIAAAVEHARRHRTMTAVIRLGLDSFRMVNDQHGHERGDELLREIAAQLSRRLRDEDTVARIGGDEFLIMLPSIRDIAGIVRPAQELLHLCAAAAPAQGPDVTASMGIAVFPLDTDEPEQLLHRADRALHDAKRAGKNQYRFASPAAMSVAPAVAGMQAPLPELPLPY